MVVGCACVCVGPCMMLLVSWRAVNAEGMGWNESSGSGGGGLGGAVAPL